MSIDKHGDNVKTNPNSYKRIKHSQKYDSHNQYYPED